VEEGRVSGHWANVAADLWKVFGLLLVGKLWRSQQRSLATLLFLIWMLCLLWGMAGAIGVYAQDRTALIDGRHSTAETLSDARREMADVEDRLAGLTSRSVTQIDAAVASVLARPVRAGDRLRGTVGKLSANCARADRDTAEACLEIARLNEERTGAAEATRWRERAAELRMRIAALRERGGTLPADPSAELLAWLSGGQIQVEDISFGFPLVFALLIELISAFGPPGIVAFAEATRGGRGSVSQPAIASRGELRRAAAGLSEARLVAAWMADRTEPTSDGAAITIETLHANYCGWCVSRGVASADQFEFQRAFDSVRDEPEMRGTIRKFGDRYDGIALIVHPALARKRAGE